MEEYATNSDWQFKLVTYDNLDTFLTEESYDECMRILDSINFEFKQMRADIIRLELLKDNGGIWVDSSTFFIENLDWVNNVTQLGLPFIN